MRGFEDTLEHLEAADMIQIETEIWRHNHVLRYSRMQAFSVEDLSLLKTFLYSTLDCRQPS